MKPEVLNHWFTTRFLSGISIFFACVSPILSQGVNVPDEFKQPVILSMETLDFTGYGLKYTPTYIVVQPPEPSTCRGAMFFSTHHDNLGAGRGKGMEALLSGDKITALLKYMWEEYNF